MRSGLPHGRNAVRDQDHGAALHHPGQVRQDALLGQRVHARKRVVQNQDARVAQNRPGDGGALLLPARKRDAALAHHRLVALGKALDVLGQAGDFGRPADLVAGSPIPRRRRCSRRSWR